MKIREKAFVRMAVVCFVALAAAAGAGLFLHFWVSFAPTTPRFQIRGIIAVGRGTMGVRLQIVRDPSLFAKPWLSCDGQIRHPDLGRLISDLTRVRRWTFGSIDTNWTGQLIFPSWTPAASLLVLIMVRRFWKKLRNAAPDCRAAFPVIEPAKNPSADSRV